MQEATDRLTQDTPHDIALGRCSFAGLQLTVTKQASRVSNDGMIGNCAGQRRKLWPKGRIATHTLPRRSVQMRRACRTMVDPGISAGGAVPSAHGMAWHGMLRPGVLWSQRLSRFHSWRTLHWHASGSVEQRWGCRNVWPPATGMVAGSALADPSRRRRLGGWANSAPAKAALLVSHQRCQSRGGIIHAHDRALIFSCAER